MIILLIALLVAADQISKYLVAANLAGRNIEIIHNFFYITYAENTGMQRMCKSNHSVWHQADCL